MLEVDKNTFQTEVLEADGYVFVDFFGDGCVPCAALMPKVHEFADTYGDKLKFTSLNTTKARRLAIGQKILGLPVMAIYKDGEKVEEVVKDTGLDPYTTPMEIYTTLDTERQDVINGIIVGKPKEEKYYKEYKEVYRRVIGKTRKDLPIIYNVNIGHAQPIGILPYGIKCELDLDNKKITLKENFLEK